MTTVRLRSFYDIATQAYLNNWGASFHLPPFAPGQTLDQACTAQERHIAGHFAPGQHVLDLGCGIGGPARTIAATIPRLRVTGVNVIQEQLDIAARHTADAGPGSRITYTRADFAHLPFPDRHLDGAYTFDSLCHSPDKQATYREIHRVLASGAIFAGADWMHADNLSPIDYDRWIEPVCRYAALPDLLSPGTTSRLLTEAGFTVRTCRDLGQEADLTPNWDLLDDAATSIANHQGPAHQFMYLHCTTTAAAGRTGAFTIGEWTAIA